MTRRSILMQDAESRLARALRRLFPPSTTTWNSICMDCDRVYGVQHLPYDERHGREVNSHGLCVTCAAHRGVPDLDEFADGRRDQTQRKHAERDRRGVSAGSLSTVFTPHQDERI